MRLIAALVLLVLLAAGAYTAYWYFAAGRIRAETNDWAAAREAEGWTVSRTALKVDGFPGAHRMTIAGIEVAAPQSQGGWTMRANELRIGAAAPWNFGSWTVRPQGEVHLRLSSGEEVRLAAAESMLELDASAGVIDHFYAEADALAISAVTAPLQGADSVFVQGDRDGGAWRVLFEGRGADIAEGAFGDARGAFGAEVAVLALDLQAQEEGLAALAAGFAGLKDAGDLIVNAAHLEWGAAQLSGEGAVGVDAQGRLRGTFDIAVADPAAFLGALAGAGVLDARQANVALAASSFFPRDEDDRIVLPFGFEDGSTMLGPVAIGPSPRVIGRGDDLPPLPDTPPTPIPAPEAPPAQ